LVTAITKPVDNGVAIARLEFSDSLTALADRRQIIVDSQLEKQRFASLFGPERLERPDEKHAVSS
jgi:hypothetical protein